MHTIWNCADYSATVANCQQDTPHKATFCCQNLNQNSKFCESILKVLTVLWVYFDSFHVSLTLSCSVRRICKLISRFSTVMKLFVSRGALLKLRCARASAGLPSRYMNRPEPTTSQGHFVKVGRTHKTHRVGAGAEKETRDWDWWSNGFRTNRDDIGPSRQASDEYTAIHVHPFPYRVFWLTTHNDSLKAAIRLISHNAAGVGAQTLVRNQNVQNKSSGACESGRNEKGVGWRKMEVQPLENSCVFDVYIFVYDLLGAKAWNQMDTFIDKNDWHNC